MPPPPPAAGGPYNNDLDDDYDSNASSEAGDGRRHRRGDESDDESLVGAGERAPTPPSVYSSRSASPQRADVSSKADGTTEMKGLPDATAAATTAVPQAASPSAMGPSPSPVCCVKFRRLSVGVPGRSTHVTPYLVYQLLRPFGFPKRVLVFTNRNGIAPGASAFQYTTRGLAQFDSTDDCRGCLESFAKHGEWLSKDACEARAEVHLGGDCPDVFHVTMSFAEESRVFATSNTSHSIVVSPASLGALGAQCGTAPLTSAIGPGSQATAAPSLGAPWQRPVDSAQPHPPPRSDPYPQHPHHQHAHHHQQQPVVTAAAAGGGYHHQHSLDAPLPTHGVQRPQPPPPDFFNA